VTEGPSMVVHIAEALGAFLLRVKSIGWNQTDCGGIYGGRTLRLNIRMNTYALAAGISMTGMLAMSVEEFCNNDTDLIDWSKDTGITTCGELRKHGCKFAAEKAMEKKSKGEADLRNQIGDIAYEKRVEDAVKAWETPTWDNFEYCIRIDAGRKVPRRQQDAKSGAGKHLCGVDDCEYKAKKASTLKQHKAMVHDLDVTFYLCGVGSCEYKAKKASALKKHKAAVHDIDVTFYVCGVDDCRYKTKQDSHLKRHKASVHDLDKKNKMGKRNLDSGNNEEKGVNEGSQKKKAKTISASKEGKKYK